MINLNKRIKKVLKLESTRLLYNSKLDMWKTGLSSWSQELSLALDAEKIEIINDTYIKFNDHEIYLGEIFFKDFKRYYNDTKLDIKNWNKKLKNF
jgi:hypothetical protein